MESSPEFEELLDLLDLQPDGPLGFRGGSPKGRTRALFGGQLVAQALIAAGRTTPAERVPHSLHAYFLRPGDPTKPLDFAVEAIRDGRNYHHRQVVVTQQGREIFRQLAGFTVDQPGASYQALADTPDAATDAVDPASLTDYIGWTMAGTDNPDHPWPSETTAIEVTFEQAPPAERGAVVTGQLRMWMRLRGSVPGADPLLHGALLAWMSDKTLADLAILCHGYRWLDHGVSSVSLDHSMWFHEPARADGWLRFDQEVDRTAGGRGLVRGRFVTPDGRQVAAAAQEAVVGLPD